MAPEKVKNHNAALSGAAATPRPTAAPCYKAPSLLNPGVLVGEGIDARFLLGLVVYNDLNFH